MSPLRNGAGRALHRLGHLDRERMPSIAAYLRERHGRELKGGAEWLSCRCPNPGHRDDAPSFRVNRDGGFLCHGCGIRGGDAVALHRAVTGLDFIEACRDLGCWMEGQPATRRRGR